MTEKRKGFIARQPNSADIEFGKNPSWLQSVKLGLLKGAFYLPTETGLVLAEPLGDMVQGAIKLVVGLAILIGSSISWIIGGLFGRVRLSWGFVGQKRDAKV